MLCPYQAGSARADRRYRAAAVLGLERSHLYRRMKPLGISPAEP